MTIIQSNDICYDITRTAKDLARAEELEGIIAFAYDNGFDGITEKSFEIKTDSTETIITGKNTGAIYAKETNSSTYTINFNILKSSIKVAHMKGCLDRANNKITEIEDTLNFKTRNNK